LMLGDLVLLHLNDAALGFEPPIGGANLTHTHLHNEDISFAKALRTVVNRAQKVLVFNGGSEARLPIIEAPLVSFPKLGESITRPVSCSDSSSGRSTFRGTKYPTSSLLIEATGPPFIFLDTISTLVIPGA
jgi:hypothetical protein